MYENLALKYRPKFFSDLVGQEHVSKTLFNAVKSGKIHHSYLFYGPRGCGKTSTARILAKSLNCKQPENYQPCNKCISCKEITQSSSIDVIEIDAASYTQVQNIREVILDNVNLSPARDNYRIYILDEVHMLSTSAFNALLKTIEEPPEHAVFILATTEIHKVPLTIISRCQTFRFKPIPPEIMIKRLEEICKLEKINYDKDALALIVEFSGGAMRDALSLLDKAVSFSGGDLTYESVSSILGYPPKEIVHELAENILSRSIPSIHSVFKKISVEGYDIIAVLKELRNYFSRCFFSKYGLDDEVTVEGDYNPFLYAKLSRKINRIIDEIKYSDNLNLVAEISIYTMLDNTVDVERIMKNIGSINLNETADSVEKSEPSKNTEDTKDKSGFSTGWKKLLTAVMNENIPLYNVLLSSDVKLENNAVNIYVDSEFKKSLIEKNLSLIKKSLGQNYSINILVKKKLKQDKSIFISPENNDSHGAVFVDISAEDEVCPELERLKKVFGESIIKVIKNK